MIYAKLLEIQKIGVNAEKDGKNPHFKSNYVTLDNLLNTILPLATANGLAITSFVENDKLVTKVVDTEDESSIESRFSIYHEDPQKIGSAITYAKRYNLGAIFNLVTEVDDDGNFSSGETTKVYNTPKNDLMDYIDRIKQCNDDNELKTIFTEAYKIFPTEKQRTWLTKVKDESKERISNNQ